MLNTLVSRWWISRIRTASRRYPVVTHIFIGSSTLNVSLYSENRRAIYFSPQKRLKHGRKNITLHWINGIIRNNKCIFPCGTPLSTEVAPSTLTCCDLSERNALIQLSVVPLIPSKLSFESRWCGTQQWWCPKRLEVCQSYCNFQERRPIQGRQLSIPFPDLYMLYGTRTHTDE
jgi:hypothetical protein